MFAKTPSDALASLVKEIDKAVGEHKSEKLAAVVNFTGDPTDEYTAAIKKFAEDNKIENVALTTTADGDKFKVNEDAEFTLLAYKGKKVLFNFAATKEGLAKADVKEVIQGASKLVD